MEVDPTKSTKEGVVMSKSIGGVYRDGKVELTQIPSDIPDGTRVIVTFRETSQEAGPGSGYDLRELGINETQAADLRSRLRAFSEDWESPEMDIYDHYAKSSR